LDPVDQESGSSDTPSQPGVRLLQLLSGRLDDSFSEPLPSEELKRWFPDADEG
jgi:hypothetical protein